MPTETNPEFDLAFSFVNETHTSLFLTGKAGTGKTTFLKKVAAECSKEIVVLAPTGIAALNAGGQTIHSFFQLPFHPLLFTDPQFMTPIQQQKYYGQKFPDQNIYRSMGYNSNQIKLLKSMDLLIIDEVSMVRADIIDMIDRLLRVYRDQLHRPFGGVQVVLIGDPYQLPPIVTRDEAALLDDLYAEGTAFFHSMVFRKMILNKQLLCISLEQVYRQKDQIMVDLLNKVRNGNVGEAELKLLNQRVCPVPKDNEKGLVQLCTHNREAVQTNNAKLNQLNTPLFSYEGHADGKIKINDLPCEETLRLKVGAQVVFIRNHRGGAYVNGTIAEVVRLAENLIEVKLPDGELQEVEQETWEKVHYTCSSAKVIEKKVLGSFTQYPLRLAWAITVHKSQGLSLDQVQVNLQHAFVAGQTYVALSRATQWEGLYLSQPIGQAAIMVDPRVKRFMDQFPQMEELSKEYVQSAANTKYRQAVKALAKGDLAACIASFKEGLKIAPLDPDHPKYEQAARVFWHKRYKQDVGNNKQEDPYQFVEEKLLSGNFIHPTDEQGKPKKLVILLREFQQLQLKYRQLDLADYLKEVSNAQVYLDLSEKGLAPEEINLVFACVKLLAS